MKELGLQELLRYALSGGIGTASLLLMYPKVACLIGRIEGAGEVTLIVGAILVVGTLVYNLHRALLFPPFFRLIGWITLRGINPGSKVYSPWRPSKPEIDVDYWRWKRRDKDRRRWDEWAAQTHSLYCAAWAMLAALVFGPYLGSPPNCRARHIVGVLFVVTLIAGIVNNYRLLYTINAERQSYPETGATVGTQKRPVLYT